MSAPTINVVKVSIDGPGKVGLIAMRPGAQFPLDIITDVLISSQVADKHAEMMVDSPGPSGFIIYVISEGVKCDVEIDGMGKMLLEVSHNDLNF